MSFVVYMICPAAGFDFLLRVPLLWMWRSAQRQRTIMIKLFNISKGCIVQYTHSFLMKNWTNLQVRRNLEDLNAALRRNDIEIWTWSWLCSFPHKLNRLLCMFLFIDIGHTSIIKGNES
jgi:hypothetical protein